MCIFETKYLHIYPHKISFIIKNDPHLQHSRGLEPNAGESRDINVEHSLVTFYDTLLGLSVFSNFLTNLEVN